MVYLYSVTSCGEVSITWLQIDHLAVHRLPLQVEHLRCSPELEFASYINSSVRPSRDPKKIFFLIISTSIYTFLVPLSALMNGCLHVRMVNLSTGRTAEVNDLTVLFSCNNISMTSIHHHHIKHELCDLLSPSPSELGGLSMCYSMLTRRSMTGQACSPVLEAMLVHLSTWLLQALTSCPAQYPQAAIPLDRLQCYFE